MKKIMLSTVSAVREVGANEYPVRFWPKSAGSVIVVNGVEAEVKFTSGRGKSAVNNEYVYFREGEKMYYAKLNAGERSELKGIADAVGEVAEVAEVAVEAVAEAPKALRVRRAK